MSLKIISTIRLDNMKRRDIYWKLAVIGSLFSCGPKILAAEGGYSNYIPGTYGDFAAAVQPAQGITIRNDIYNYSADGDGSVRAGLLEVGAELEFTIYLLTVLHNPGIKLWGGNFSYGALLTLVDADVSANLQIANNALKARDDALGMGDITLVPAIIFWQSGNYHFSLAEYIVTPTGSYDKDELINTGLNYWTFDTNVAATYLNEETGQDYSINIGYSYNTENNDTDYQTGQEIHIDYMINQFLSEHWAVGVHGFYLEQITGDSGDGSLLGDFKGKAAGIGPAVLYASKAFNHDVTFIAKWLNEYDAEKRLEGDHIMLSFALNL